MMQLDEEWVRWAVSGRVQRVGFRWFVMRVARDARLRGWVRNNPDGSVEIEAAGTPANIALLRERVAVGPRGARVDSIVTLPASGRMLPDPFEII